MLAFRRSLASISRVRNYSTPAAAKASGIFQSIPQAPADPILGLSASFRAETNPKKINLSVGAYRDDAGKPWILPSVKLAYEKLHEENKEYTGINGSVKYKELVRNFLFGSWEQGAQLIEQDRISIAQTLSGTGALFLTGRFLTKWLDIQDVYVPKPTWANHINVFQSSGLNTHFYSYLDSESNTINFDALIADLKAAKEGSAVLLHASCHNPTGLDPTPEQFVQIAEVVAEKKLIPIVDMAYQGFQSGSLTGDLDVLKLIVSKVEEGSIPTFFFCQSFAKNMGLYGERVGSLSIVAPDADSKTVVDSQMQKIIRGIYSSPPIHGSELVETVLSNPEIQQQWAQDVTVMAERIKAMRFALYERLQAKGHDWSHLIAQNGMFCYTGLTEPQVLKLRSEFGVYCTNDGRFSISGINEGNVDYLAEAIHNVLQ